ncbi:MAG: Ig-like domain repeat protein [Acidimicrobiaceae bacterium]|nr:Ig-like domain repeat protein [Acidimicrobiaceae bacterium]
MAVPTANHGYLGAYLDPAGQGLFKSHPNGGRGALRTELADLPSFNQHLGRPLSIVQAYQNWNRPVTVTSLTQIWATGAIPMVTWGCLVPDGQVADGNKHDDNIIKALADELHSTGIPVLLRWFPDANVTNKASKGCLGTGGAAEYRKAFQHIRSVFAAAGATNVAFVWSVDTTVGNPTIWKSFYPGAGAVDWIGADALYRTSSSTLPPNTFAGEFASWYDTFKTFRGVAKPLIISDTAAAGGGSVQAQYLHQAANAIPSEFPLLKGLVYHDAPDKSTDSVYTLRKENLVAFRDLSKGAYFLERRSPSTVTVSATPSSVTVGQITKITATVSGPDTGGSLRFVDANGPIGSCTAVPVYLGAVCETSSLSEGQHAVQVMYSGDADSAPSTSVPINLQVSAGTPSLAPPPIPPGAYLGGWIEQLPKSKISAESSRVNEELQELPGFNAGLARSLSLVHVYQSWTEPLPMYQIRQVLADGAIPLLDWRCGDSDANIISGADDTLISGYAHQLAALRTPIFLRWFYEPNLLNNKSWGRCISTAGPLGYVEAFRHIHDLFAAAGATNVAFVWATGSSGDPDLMQYFPGSQYVDWIAADGYDRIAVNPRQVFSQTFGKWYDEFSGFGLPMMVSETGAKQSAAQAAYVSHLESSFPTQFPQIKALCYFDANGNFNYVLRGPSLKAFRHLAANPYFQPPRHPTTVSPVTISPTPPKAGQEVALSASMGSTDLGGSVTFYANGSRTPLPGCAKVPISAAATCNTDALAEGNDSLTVSYSGDAWYSPVPSSVASSTMVSPQPVYSRPLLPRVPTNSAYLGASVIPSGGGRTAEVRSLGSFNAGLGRHLSIVNLYQAWNDETPTYQLRQVLASGAIPMITWECGNSDAAIVSGADDALIISFAHELAALDAPVFLRWGFEPNFANSPEATTCVGPEGPHTYQLAYERIHDLFEGAGATNVAFVWNVALSGQQQNLTDYYPGRAYVDWISADGFVPSTLIAKSTLKTLLGGWYKQFSSFGKPLMIAETGAYAGGQSVYLGQLQYELPKTFPGVKALLYYDAAGRSGHQPYALDASGLHAFQAISRVPYFEPARLGTALQVTAARGVAAPGRIRMTATLPAPDKGGTVGFVADGVSVAGCDAVPVSVTPTCATNSLAGGHHTIVAVYSGDAQFDPSLSGPVGTTAGPGLNESSPGAGADLSSLNFMNFGAMSSSLWLPDLAGLRSMAALRGEDNRPPVFASLFGAKQVLDQSESAAVTLPDGGGSQGVSTLVVLAILAIALCLMSYVGVTWASDRRRLRLAGGGNGSGEVTPHEGAEG